MTAPPRSRALLRDFVLLIALGEFVVQSFIAKSTPLRRKTLLFGKLDGCVCVVTGASRGIGKGIALALGKEGATVYITGTSTSSSLSSRPGPYTTNEDVGGVGTVEDTARLVTEAGGKGIGVVCNHAIDADVKALFERVEAEQGRLDVLINNAFRVPPGGPSKLFGRFWEQDIDLWDVITTVGLRGYYTASYYAVPLILKSRATCKLARPLVGMVSSFGGLTYTFNLPYGVAKAAVDRLAKDMSIELNKEDVCVVSVWPGVVKTERTEMLVANGEWQKNVDLPLDQAESPEFTGRAMVALLTDPENMSKSGTYQVVAELAQEYGFTDVDGRQPPSIRSLRFLIPSYALDAETREKIPDWLIPDWKLPFWVMAQGRPPEKQSDDYRAV